ncbi:MAG: hypothetical protein V3V01_13525 [Acidimicrobiales bacterium]
MTNRSLPRFEQLKEGNPLPPGSFAIGGGLVINGIATFGFLTIANRALGDEAYSGLAVLWALVFIFGPGFFQPLEQELSRATAARASRGEGSAPILAKTAILGAGLLGIVTVGLVIAWPLGLDSRLDSEPLLLVSLILAMVAFSGSQLIRGILAGRHRYGRYGIFFGVDGLVRLVSAIVLAAVGVKAVGPFGLAVGGGIVLAAIAASRGREPLARPGPDAAWNEITPSLGFLLGAALFEAFLLNIGPVAVDTLAGAGEEVEAGRFLNGLLTARVPLFFFQAVKAALLPNLADAVGRRDFERFRTVLVRLLSAVVAIAAFGVAFAWVAGPFIVDLLFDDVMSRTDMALLAASSGLFMAALSLAIGLIALEHQGYAVLGWFIGVAMFIPGVSLADDLFLRVELGLIVAVLSTTLLMAVLCRHGLRTVRLQSPPIVSA